MIAETHYWVCLCLQRLLSGLFWLSTFVTCLCTDDFPPTTVTAAELNPSTQWIYCVSISGAGTLSQTHTVIWGWVCVVFFLSNIKTCSLTRSPLLHCHSVCSSLAVSSSAVCIPSPHLHSLPLFFLPSAVLSSPAHLFPLGSQATKYSDWCRQLLGLITNGKQSRAEQWGCTEREWTRCRRRRKKRHTAGIWIQSSRRQRHRGLLCLHIETKTHRQVNVTKICPLLQDETRSLFLHHISLLMPPEQNTRSSQLAANISDETL